MLTYEQSVIGRFDFTGSGHEAAAPAEPALLLQKPTLSRTHIVFAYAGDLWIVAREGGSAKQLTTGVGIESNPVFSPDGSLIAFTGQYDGNTDVYTIPAAGGVPKRLTFHPDADDVVGWTRDGQQILFRQDATATQISVASSRSRLEGGLPTEVPLPMADEAHRLSAIHALAGRLETLSRRTNRADLDR